jgi:hypothetical protein
MGDEVKAAAEWLLELGTHSGVRPVYLYERAVREDGVAVARAVLAAGWRPIESAPRDGTRVLLVGRWITLPGHSGIVIGHWAERWWSGGVPIEPSHYMPLPKPPPATCEHVWGIDGMHSNEYCKKCFVPKPPGAE